MVLAGCWDWVIILTQNSIEFPEQLIDKVSHMHIKDVSESLAVRGAQTGIAISHCFLSKGVNVDSVRWCLELLRDRGHNGVLSRDVLPASNIKYRASKFR